MVSHVLEHSDSCLSYFLFFNFYLYIKHEINSKFLFEFMQNLSLSIFDFLAPLYIWFYEIYLSHSFLVDPPLQTLVFHYLTCGFHQSTSF